MKTVRMTVRQPGRGGTTPTTTALQNRFLRKDVGVASTPRTDFLTDLVLEAVLQESSQLRRDRNVDAQIRRFRPELIRRTVSVVPQNLIKDTGYRASFGLLMMATIITLADEIIPVKAQRATSVVPIGIGFDALNAAIDGLEDPNRGVVCRRPRTSAAWKYGMSSAHPRDKVESQLLWSKNDALEVMLRPKPIEFMKLVDSLV